MKATFRFYDALNDFLINSRKNSWMDYDFNGNPAVKDAIEALGVPHPEVQVILINQTPVSFGYQLQANDQVEVFTFNSKTAFPDNYLLLPNKPQEIKFVLDVHLGKLTKGLRMLGFDALYQNNFNDKTILNLAFSENRIVLTRDVGLLKQKEIQFGYWLRSQLLELQLKEVIGRFQLTENLQPFSRCLACNGLLNTVKKETILNQLPPNTRLYFNEFFQCKACKRIYWKGSHFDRMQQFIQQFSA